MVAENLFRSPGRQDCDSFFSGPVEFFLACRHLMLRLQTCHDDIGSTQTFRCDCHVYSHVSAAYNDDVSADLALHPFIDFKEIQAKGGELFPIESDKGPLPCTCI